MLFCVLVLPLPFCIYGSAMAEPWNHRCAHPSPHATAIDNERVTHTPRPSTYLEMPPVVVTADRTVRPGKRPMLLDRVPPILSDRRLPAAGAAFVLLT